MKNTSSVLITGLRNGLIFGLIMIIITLIQLIIGFRDNLIMPFRLINYLIFFIIIIFAHINFKKEAEGYLSFVQAFRIGVTIAFIGFIIQFIFILIYLNYIDYSYFNTFATSMLEKMEEQNASEEDIKNLTEYFTPFRFYGIIAFIDILISFIISLIVSLFTRKEK